MVRTRFGGDPGATGATSGSVKGTLKKLFAPVIAGLALLSMIGCGPQQDGGTINNNTQPVATATQPGQEQTDGNTTINNGVCANVQWPTGSDLSSAHQGDTCCNSGGVSGIPNAGKVEPASDGTKIFNACMPD